MHALHRALERGQLMVMGRKHRLRAELFLIRAVLQHGAGDGHAVVGGGAAAYLVEDEQAPACRIAQDIGDLAHFEHEGRLSRGKVVRGADAGEDPVDHADDGAFCRNEGAYLRHEHDERRLAHIGALAGHVGAGDDGGAAALAVEIGVVGHEPHVAERLLDDGVPPLAYYELAGGVDLGHAVAVAHRDLGKGAEHVQPCDRVCRCLHLSDLFGNGAAQVHEEAVLKLLYPVGGRQQVRFELLELLGEIPFV